MFSYVELLHGVPVQNGARFVIKSRPFLLPDLNNSLTTRRLNISNIILDVNWGNFFQSFVKTERKQLFNVLFSFGDKQNHYCGFPG